MLAVWRTLALLFLVAAGMRPLHAQKVSPVRPGTKARPAVVGGAQLSAAERRALLAIATVENARALGADGAAPLVAALADPSPVVRRAAVRALGRLQRADLLTDIEGAVNDADLRVQLEAINAIAQSLQGLRVLEPASADRRRALDDGVDALVGAAERLPSPSVLATAARSLGRLPYGDSIVPREVERVIAQMGDRPGPGGRPLARSDAAVAAGMMHGLYALARSGRTTGSPSPVARSAMRWATTFGLDSARPGGGATTATGQEAAARVRRLAYLALAAARDTSGELVRRALRDTDEQVRRLAVVSAVALEDSVVRRQVVTSALRDPSFLVRFEGVRSYRTLPAPRVCAPLFRATLDPNPHVALAAVDALGGGCDDRGAATDSLIRLAATPVAAVPARPKGGTSWHRRAHALLALSRLSPTTAIPLLRQDALHPVWQVRLYVARAALVVRDTLTLSSLAFDANGNVREAALAGISATVGHAADKVYLAALSALDYQVVLQAAQALRGAPAPDSVVPALFTALERLTAERRENARDPRVALVERIGELGNERQAQRLAPYLTDFDSTLAVRAATIMERWTLRRSVAAPRRLPLSTDAVDQVIGSDLRLLVRMAARSGGGVFVVRLQPDEAPLTVARIVKLVREGHYAGRTFHRVEPAFVIQGGSPAASEFVGDGPFMRDEVGLPSHLRGTLGISTRGRDTGDAQLFVNLTDNVRLDHDYTVFGEIIQGREVAEGVIEGDVIERVDVVRVR
ncbi:MAG: peptidylprolyl isomerase [Gemmatimonadaceae bacterium]|nr:peptidylprolyl isomerase [Gemmatimonadaceae bacterium]